MRQEASRQKFSGVAALVGTLVLGGLIAVDAQAGVKIKQTLSPTAANPNANGQAAVVVSGHGHRRKGKLKLIARKLAPGKTFRVRVAGVSVATFTANAAGSGRATLSTRPGPKDATLGVDPRGQHLAVSDEQGEDELETDIPDDSSAPCCCSDANHDGEQDGEEMDPQTCVGSGGTVSGAPSCLPDPCNDSGGDIRCCVAGDQGAECDLTTTTECGDNHGVNLGAGSCDPNPCATEPPPTVTRCCVADNEPGDEGEAGGTTHVDCEQLTATHCADEGGTDAGAGSCEPNPCVGSPSGAFVESVLR